MKNKEIKISVDLNHWEEETTNVQSDVATITRNDMDCGDNRIAYEYIMTVSSAKAVFLAGIITEIHSEYITDFHHHQLEFYDDDRGVINFRQILNDDGTVSFHAYFYTTECEWYAELFEEFLLGYLSGERNQ